MATCWHCGEEIEFRYIDGQCTPLHLSGGWCQGSGGFSGHTQTPSQYSERQPSGNYVRADAIFDDICRPTVCPRCKKFVYFIRHNGGSVWVDELGWPWPKHSCFKKDADPSWFAFFKKHTDSIKPGTLPVGVIIKAKWLPRDKDLPCRIILAVDCGTKYRLCLATNGTNTADYLLGRVVIVDAKNGRLITSNHEVRPILPLTVEAQDLGLDCNWAKAPKGK